MNGAKMLRLALLIPGAVAAVAFSGGMVDDFYMNPEGGHGILLSGEPGNPGEAMTALFDYIDSVFQPDLKVNGSDTPVTAGTEDSISVEVKLMGGVLPARTQTGGSRRRRPPDGTTTSSRVLLRAGGSRASASPTRIPCSISPRGRSSRRPASPPAITPSISAWTSR